MSFELGKHAALDGLAEMIDNGYDVEDIMAEIEEILSQDLEKNASEFDLSFRKGAESALYDFIKEAELNSYEMSTSDAIVSAFNKVAELDDPGSGDVYSRYNDLADKDQAEVEEGISLQEIHQQLKTAGLF